MASQGVLGLGKADKARLVRVRIGMAGQGSRGEVGSDGQG